MKALLKIEWIKTWRSWPVFIMGIGIPVGFFLLFSSIFSAPTPEAQKEFLLSYMLTMTGFSMSSFGLFTFPYMLQEDRIEHWLTYIEHSKVSIAAYYLSKIFRVLLNFMVAIIVTFCVGAFFRDVEMPFFRWVGSGALLLLSGLLFLAFGLLIAQIKSQQFMSLVANIIYLVLPIVSGSWVPISMFPKWVQSISEWTPVYHVNELVVNFAKDGTFSWKSLLFILAYTVVATGLALFIKSQRESRDTTPYAMRHEEKEKQVTLPSSFVSIVHGLPDIYEITEKRDVISFMTKDIEKVWQSLENSGCGISDIEIQNKTLLDSLFDSTREDKA